MAKRWVNHTFNTSTAFDASAFRECTASHLLALQDENLISWIGLVPPLHDAPLAVCGMLENVFGGGNTYKASLAARVSDFEIIRQHDVVEGWTGEEAFVGKVQVHLAAGSETVTILETWTCTKRQATYSEWCTKDSQLTLVRSADITTAVTHACTGTKVTVLHSGKSRRSPYAAMLQHPIFDHEGTV